MPYFNSILQEQYRCISTVFAVVISSSLMEHIFICSHVLHVGCPYLTIDKNITSHFLVCQSLLS